MEEVKAVFNKTDSPIDIYDLYLTIRLSGDFIPADLLGQSKIFGYLKLFGYTYGDGRNQSSVTVDPNAFRSSNNSLSVLHLANIDQLDFQLESIRFWFPDWVSELDTTLFRVFGDQF